MRLSPQKNWTQEIEKPSYHDRSAAVEATGILSKVQTTGFAFHLAMFYKLLGMTKPLSDVLQGNKIDIPKALTLVQTCKQQIMQARAEFESICTDAGSFWPKQRPVGDGDQTSKPLSQSLSVKQPKVHGSKPSDLLAINLSATRSKRTSKLPLSFSGFVVTERIPSESGSLTCPIAPVDCLDEDQEHRRVYYEVVDKMHAEMSTRFTDLSSSILLGIEACDPSKDSLTLMHCVLRQLALKPL